ncbi:hypothetical protein [Segetibacter koreensis]|uniref:hypothetical protein n=1 Tax=Segetibacter koreensis TaxID=398037 RepID=UPI0012FAACF4|nr:hypothetical protein [Segetibacter koreensis]
MKKITLGVMALAIGFSSMAQIADSTSNKHKTFHNRENHLGGQNLEKLNLTDDQKAQIKIVNENFRQQMQDVRKNANNNADDLKAKRRDLMKEHKEKINAILTPAQRKQAEDMRQEFAKENKGQMHGQRFEEMTKDLHLTPEQAAKMKDLNAAFRTDIQSIRQNNSLSQQEKKEQLKSLMKKHRADMETSLTDEQKEQLKNNRQNRRHKAVK